MERLPRAKRSRLRRELAAELAEYPEAEDREALEARLGTPSRYAADLAEELGVRPGRRSRPRGWGWGWVAAVLVVVGWLLLANLTTPLEPGSFSSSGSFEVTVGGDPFDEWTEVVYHQDQEGEMSSSLRNRARLSVTITDIGVFPAMDRSSRELTGWSGLFVQTGEFYEGDTPPGYGFMDDPVSFTESPLVLAPGEERTIAIQAMLTNCEFNTPGASEGHDAAMVTYSYLGLTKVATVQFPKVFTTSPQVCEAPVNREFATAPEAIADGIAPSWIPSDARDVLLATGEAGSVLSLTTDQLAPDTCKGSNASPYWSYRPSWAPSQDLVAAKDVLACPEDWFWWGPEPGEVLMWTETEYPFVAP
ncbi:MAG TPA: hypothetical protein VI193_02080 [Acidimicrobiia bacterium]